MKTALLALTAITCFAVLPAAAGPGHEHRPQHGGIVREIGDLTIELVARSERITVHLADHGKPVATAGATGRVTLHGSGGKTEIALQPAGENRMEARGNFRVGIGVRAALALALPGKAETKAVFNLN